MFGNTHIYFLLECHLKSGASIAVWQIIHAGYSLEAWIPPKTLRFCALKQSVSWICLFDATGRSSDPKIFGPKMLVKFMVIFIPWDPNPKKKTKTFFQQNIQGLIAKKDGFFTSATITA